MKWSRRELARALVPPALMVWKGRPERAPERRRIALTFDDGPTPLTGDYLSVLERYEARATFFLLGKHCARHPDFVRAMVQGGHELAVQGYSHRRFTELSWPELQEELERTRAWLPESARGRPLVRPPHGAVSFWSSLACARAGFRCVLWSRDSGDWCTRRADDVLRRFDDELEPGTIVLFHEGQAWTLRALPKILENLRKAGHELCTVGELLGN